MKKRVVIAGSRNYTDYNNAKFFIDKILAPLKSSHDIIILSGCCRGADKIGEQYAAENGYIVEKYPADWARYKRGAGLMRNREMIDKCDIVICFWDEKSSGTKYLIDYAKAKERTIAIETINC